MTYAATTDSKLDFDFGFDTPTEGDKTAEQGDKDKDSEGKKGAKTDDLIPKARFDEEIARLRAELDAVKNPKAKVPDVDPIAELQTKVSALEDKLDDATDPAQRKELRKQLRVAQEQYQTAREQRAVTHAASTTNEQVQYAQVVKEIESTHPQLDSTNSAYDAELTGDVIAFMQGLVSSNNLSRAEALRRAVNRFVPSKPAQNSRDAASRLRNADAMHKQPPDANKMGKGMGAKDAGLSGTIDEGALEKMDEQELAYRRGDFIE